MGLPISVSAQSDLFHKKSSKPLVIKLIVEVKVVPNLNRA